MPNGCFGSKVSDRPEVPSPSSFRITLKVSREFVESRIGFERIWKFLLGTRQTLEGPWLDRFPKEQPASTPRVTDQAPQGQSRKARIPNHPNTGGSLTSGSFWRAPATAFAVVV
jgi:hypothetical protein